MNILDHILAGHYPLDSKGRALVPMRADKLSVCVVATDNPLDPNCPIVGFILEPRCDDREPRLWRADGFYHGPNSHSRLDLLPPPPRKGMARAWVVYPTASDGLPCWGELKAAYDNPDDPARIYPGAGWAVVEMTHEYEIPWEDTLHGVPLGAKEVMP